MITFAHRGINRGTVLTGMLGTLLTVLAFRGVEWSAWHVAVLLVGIFLLWFLVRDEPLPLSSQIPWVLLCGVAFWVLLSSLLNHAYASGLERWPMLIGYLVVFLFGAKTARRLPISRIAAPIVLLSAGLVVAAFVKERAFRIESLLGNSNALGAALIIAIPLAALLVRRSTGLLRVVWTVTLALGVLGLIASASYTAIVALGIAAVVTLVIAAAAWKLHLRRSWLYGSVLAIGLLYLALVGIRLADTRNLASALAVQRTIPLENIKISFAQRLEFNRVALRMLGDRPLVGFGYGTFQSVFARYGTTPLEQPRFAHNDYLELAAEAGLPALLLLAAALFVVLRNAVRTLRSGVTFERVAVVAAVLAALVHASLDFGWHFPFVALSAWLLMGWMVGSAETRERVASSRWLRSSAATFAVIILLRGLDLAYAAALEDQAVIAGNRARLPAAEAAWRRSSRWDPRPDALGALADIILLQDPGRVDAARGELRSALRLDPYDYFNHHRLARIDFDREDYTSSERELRLTLAADPLYHVAFSRDLFIVLRKTGRADQALVGALSLLERYDAVAFSANPQNAEAKADVAILAGQVFRERGQSAKAREMFERAVAYDPSNESGRQELRAAGGTPPPLR